MALSASRRNLVFAALAAVALGLIVWGFLPEPVPVEVTVVQRGPLQVTADEDAETRAHDRYVVSAPVAGRISRIELHEGDALRAGQVVTQLWPVPLSAREREEQLARITAAEALARAAQERVRHAAADYQQAQRERQRVDKLVREGFISPQGAEQARVMEMTGANELEAARFQARSAQADAQAARAALLALDDARGGVPAAIPVRSPVDAKVLPIPDKSERVVTSGAPLVVVGDPSQLEVVIDLLSTEAVKVKPGMPVLLEAWGGEHPLQARVRVVEPLGFTKVSALGVEEQRVNVIADFVDPPGPLGDAYRVEARVVLWSDDVLKVPVSAVFRRGDNWSVFVVEGRRARRRDVELGHRGQLEVEILAGVKAGERVVRHPSNEVEDGRRVRITE
jgi:HlyD family secretion protein